MNIKWAIGAVIAVLAATLVLPGVASAHHPEVNANTECSGTFVIDVDYVGGNSDRRVYIEIDGQNWDDDFSNGSSPPAGMAVEQSDSHYVPTGGDDYFFFDSDPGEEDFFVLSGDFDSVQNNGGDVTVDANITFSNGFDHPNAGADDSATVTAGPDGDGDPNNDWEKCIITYCEAGDADGGADYSFQATSTNDCDPVRLCVDGESMTVTEFDAETLDGDPGSCTPGDTPPPPPPSTTEVEPEEPVEEVQEAVAEVSPAVEEVVALPAAGQGIGGISYTWIALFGLAVIGFGVATALTARQRE